MTKTYPCLNRRHVTTGLVGSLLVSPLNFASSEARAAEPKAGGVLKLGVSGSNNDTLDPATLVGSMEILLTMGQLRNCLVEINERSEAVPELASGWENSDDLKTWKFKIREGVEFHNGKKLGVADVIYSIRHHMKADSKSAAKSFLSSVTAIDADGGSVVFQLSEGNADFPYVLSDYHLQIIPEDTGSDFSQGIGTGGFILEKFQPGEVAITRKNKNYWKNDRAHFDRIETYSINDSTAKNNALLAGELDVIVGPDLKTIDLVKNTDNIQLAATSGRAHPTLAMWVTEPPFDDNEFRLALKYAIDRQDIISKILGGYGEIGNDQPISSAYRYYDDSIAKHEYNPDKAREHLKRSRTPNATVDLHTANSAFEGAVDMAILFKEQAAKVGITINVIREPDDGYWENVWLKVPFCVGNWFGRPTEDMMFSLAYAKNASWNETAWKNDQFEQLLMAARAEPSDDKRRMSYSKMQAQVSEEGGVIVPFFNADLILHRDTVAHGEIGANAPTDGFRLPERWWHV